MSSGIRRVARYWKMESMVINWAEPTYDSGAICRWFASSVDLKRARKIKFLTFSKNPVLLSIDFEYLGADHLQEKLKSHRGVDRPCLCDEFSGKEIVKRIILSWIFKEFFFI